MNNTYRYKAFGLVIDSEYPIAQLPAADPAAQVDVVIRNADLTGEGIPEDCFRFNDVSSLVTNFSMSGTFRITDGAMIEADPKPDCTESLLGVYLMGSCMGAVLHQRGYMPLHGSCVSDGEKAVLITGDSGAGKSTLAAEFLKRGWKLLTDDVAATYDVEGTPTVQCSYPSQKLWQDSLARYERSEEDIHSLYFTETRQKYGVNVASCFMDGSAPLRMIIRLLPSPDPCSITPLVGIDRLDQLMKNTYRPFMIHPDYRQRHFQRCATVAEKVPMMLLNRQEGVSCADTLYELITEKL